jgi:DNA polymerase III subunit delta'
LDDRARADAGAGVKDALDFDVVGASGPRAYFERLTRQTLAHAYIFSGAQGVGKKSFARRLAQSLLCTAPKTVVLGYDGTCVSCRLFARQAHHPDFLEHEGTLRIGERDAAGGFGAEDLTARDLVRQLSLESYTGGMRVLLLGDLDFATHHAANALLKFFEEPPSGVVLVITSSAPSRLLPTIRSRAIEVRFPLLTRAELAEILRRKGYESAQVESGSALGQGSATRAIAALEGEESSVRAQAARWFFEVVAGKTPEENWASRETLDTGLETLKGLVRDWLAMQAAKAEPLYSDYERELRALPLLSPQRVASVLSRLDDAQRLARTNVNPSMVSEIARMALTAAAPR